MRLRALRRLQCPPVRAPPTTTRQRRKVVFSATAPAPPHGQPWFDPPYRRGLAGQRRRCLESGPGPRPFDLEGVRRTPPSARDMADHRIRIAVGGKVEIERP